MNIMGAAIAIVTLLVILSYLYHKHDGEDPCASLIQREPLTDNGKRKFKIKFYHKYVEPARLPRPSREVERQVVVVYIWAVDECEALERSGAGKGIYKGLSRIEIIDWSYR